MYNPPYISDKPGKSPMGMDLLPVYDDEVSGGPTITIDPVIVQNMGVRVAKATRGPLKTTLRVVGTLVEPEQNHVEINLRVSGWIQKLYANQNGMPGLKGEIPYGLTIGRYDLEVTVNTDSMRDGSGYCAQLRAAHVEVGLKQLDVIVDRRFAAGSCQRQAVLDHEAQHVEVFREAVRYYLPALERALARTALPLNLHVADRNGARAAYLAPITDSLKPVFDAINGRARDGNTRLDMPESYAVVFKRCSQW